MKNSFHELKDSEPLHIPFDLQVTDEERTIIEEALNDIRLIAARTYREQCFILCCLLHNTDSPEIKPVISYDKIGQLFETPKIHYAIIEQVKKTLIKPLPANIPFFFNRCRSKKK